MRARRGALLVSALLLAACGGGGGESAQSASGVEPAPTTAPSAAAEDPAATPASPAETVPVPDFLAFEAEDIRGGTVSGAEFANDDLVLWFWAPW